MDSTRAPVPSGRQRLGGHNSIASQRPHLLAALLAVFFCLAVTAVVVVSPAQPSPANVLEHRPSGPMAIGAMTEADGKPDMWGGGASERHNGSGRVRPSAAFSQYVKTTKSARLSRMGCAEGKRLRGSSDPEGAIVVLAFGRPTQKGKGRGHDWGASLFRRGFHPTSDIRAAAQAYGRGARECMGEASASAHLTVAIGTSNFGPGVSYWHGRAWANMVNQANDWAMQKGYSEQVRFAGANDIELSWGGPRRSRAWVRGYDSVARWPYYDYGDAAACPPRGDCHGAWTVEDVWYVAWGARSARPLPEIYTPSGIMAEQWYRLSLYSVRKHGSHMWIAGVMSQRTACRQSRDPCRGMNNTPAKAWHQLHRWLNRDKRTAQDLHWSTDIAWSD
jgi:hypothetical protein